MYLYFIYAAESGQTSSWFTNSFKLCMCYWLPSCT